jgi:hypothetical protein
MQAANGAAFLRQKVLHASDRGEAVRVALVRPVDRDRRAVEVSAAREN